MREKTKRALMEFIEKAQKLQRFGLIEHIRSAGRGFCVNRCDQDGKSTISSSRKGLNVVNLAPTKETHNHVQAYRQDYPNNSF
jgi:hypothetical protein